MKAEYYKQESVSGQVPVLGGVAKAMHDGSCLVAKVLILSYLLSIVADPVQTWTMFTLQALMSNSNLLLKSNFFWFGYSHCVLNVSCLWTDG